MNRDDVIRWADEADLWADQELQCVGEYHPDWHEVRDIRFAALVAAAEREACAKVCEANRYEGYVPPEDGAAADYYDSASMECADAIRARGQA